MGLTDFFSKRPPEGSSRERKPSDNVANHNKPPRGVLVFSPAAERVLTQISKASERSGDGNIREPQEYVNIGPELTTEIARLRAELQKLEEQKKEAEISKLGNIIRRETEIKERLKVITKALQKEL